MLRTSVLIGLAPSIALVGLLLAPIAHAQPPTDAQAGASAPANTPAETVEAPNAASEGGPDSRKISLDDDFLVEGKLEKPSAFYVFRRSDIDYDWARLDARFSPLILESVQDPLF